MRFRELGGWLAWQQAAHPVEIDPGLERVGAAWRRLRLPFAATVLTVGGTNGKGSTAAYLDAILRAAGYETGLFTSPHLVRYQERIRVRGREVADDVLLDAFAEIDRARGDISLTFFEWSTLAALVTFARANVDVAVLEVGMGGRLDAVNVVDADVALVTSIDLDHCEWLGRDRETIGREKAGIFRAARPAIFGSREMPASIGEYARQIGADLRQLGRDFDWVRTGEHWTWRGKHGELGGEQRDLPPPALYGQTQYDNAAAVLAVLDTLGSRLPVPRSAIERGLQTVTLPGRFQIIRRSEPQPIEWVLDVAHNPAAARTLAAQLAASDRKERRIAVCGVLNDKDIEGIVGELRNSFDLWVVVGLQGPRALTPNALAERLRSVGVRVEAVAADVVAGCLAAQALAGAGDRIVVFGSFLTVADAYG